MNPYGALPRIVLQPCTQEFKFPTTEIRHCTVATMYIGAHRAYRGFIVQLETWASGPGEFNQHTPKLPFKMIEKGGTLLWPSFWSCLSQRKAKCINCQNWQFCQSCKTTKRSSKIRKFEKCKFSKRATFRISNCNVSGHPGWRLLQKDKREDLYTKFERIFNSHKSGIWSSQMTIFLHSSLEKTSSLKLTWQMVGRHLTWRRRHSSRW